VGIENSSVKNKSFIDGMAMKIRVMDGVNVQKISIFWFSDVVTLNCLLKKVVEIRYIVTIVIIIIKIIECSWNIIRCSINGEFLF
jgi:hypothetical protein